VDGSAKAPWRIEARLGAGAIAEVVRLRDAAGRTRAGKILHPSHRLDGAAAQRFAQEAAILAGLAHPNVVAVEGIVDIDGTPVLVMELVEGPSLAEILARDAPLAEPRIVALARGIAAGLACAHERGIVHRDLKPANVLVAAGDAPKLADFGMARASSYGVVDPHALAVLGTPDYMAPECLDPLAVDARTDLYALGCIVFEMACGRPPYVAATPMAVLHAHRTAPVPSLPDAVSPALRALVTALLAKAPAERPQAAAAVVAELDRIAGGGGHALALARNVTSRCPACGGPVVIELGACTGCGLATVRIEAGEHTVLVVGPGDVGDKLDSALRERLHHFLRDDAVPGLAPTPGLAKRIPRLPFTLATRLSESCAHALARALEAIGLKTQVVRGGALAVPAMRKKSWQMVGRVTAIAMTMMAGLWSQATMIGVAAVAFVGIIAGTVVWSTRSVARIRGAHATLPLPLADALGRATRALPAVTEARNREQLRGVVARVVALVPIAGSEPEAATELASAVDAAVAAAARVDALDRDLAAAGASAPQSRETLHERDVWASRLLRLAAALESLHARGVHARARVDAAPDADALDELRAHVEALEEVQRR
jgi:tRNA A-37 threonylcarbamoyl transferase component Bud32